MQLNLTPTHRRRNRILAAAAAVALAAVAAASIAVASGGESRLIAETSSIRTEAPATAAGDFPTSQDVSLDLSGNCSGLEPY